MDVTLNLLLDHEMREQVCEALRNIEGIKSVDTDLLAHDVLVVHTERSRARTLERELAALEGVVSAAVGAMASG